MCVIFTLMKTTNKRIKTDLFKARQQIDQDVIILSNIFLQTGPYIKTNFVDNEVSFVSKPFNNMAHLPAF